MLRRRDVSKPRKQSPKKPYLNFVDWFKGQFPIKQHSIESRVRLGEKVSVLRGRLRVAQVEADNADLAESIRDAALKGWVAGYAAGKYEALKGKK